MRTSLFAEEGQSLHLSFPRCTPLLSLLPTPSTNKPFRPNFHQQHLELITTEFFFVILSNLRARLFSAVHSTSLANPPNKIPIPTSPYQVCLPSTLPSLLISLPLRISRPSHHHDHASLLSLPFCGLLFFLDVSSFVRPTIRPFLHHPPAMDRAFVLCVCARKLRLYARFPQDTHCNV